MGGVTVDWPVCVAAIVFRISDRHTVHSGKAQVSKEHPQPFSFLAMHFVLRHVDACFSHGTERRSWDIMLVPVLPVCKPTERQPLSCARDAVVGKLEDERVM